jgi:uncharacterized protein
MIPLERGKRTRFLLASARGRAGPSAQYPLGTRPRQIAGHRGQAAWDHGAAMIEEALNDALKRAIKERDARTADVIRMLKTRLQERRTAKGFAGQVDDALVQDVIGAYRKQLQKALAEYEGMGERGATQAAQLRFEIEVCGHYLPRGLDEPALRALVRERLAGLGIADPKQVGRLVGDVMKTHKGQVEAADVKRVAEDLLASGRR